MVAVALLPPLVSFAILLVSGHLEAASTAILILSINVISVNLSAVAMFTILNITPRNWWESKRAKQYRTRSLLMSFCLLAALSALLYFNF